MADLPQQETINQYVADGVTTVYEYTYLVPLDGDIAVYVTPSGNTANPDADIQTLNVDYTVQEAGDINGGTITFEAASIPALGDIVTLVRNVAASIDTEYSDARNFNGANLDNDFERVMLVCQQNQSFNEDRSLKYAINSYLPNVQNNTTVPVITDADNQIWISQGGTIIAGTVANDSMSTLRSQLANETENGNGCTLVGFYDNANSKETTLKQFLNYKNVYGTDSGTTNALAITVNESFDDWYEGSQINVRISNANTGDSTISVNALTPIHIYKANAGGVTLLTGGEMPAGSVASLIVSNGIAKLLNVFQDTAALTGTNGIRGGDFAMTPWQDGYTHVSPTNHTYCADLFAFNKGGVGEVTITRDTTDPFNGDYFGANAFSPAHFKLQVTTPDPSPAASDAYGILYTMEGYDFNQFVGQPCSLMFAVRSSLTGQFCIGLQNSGFDRSYVGTYQITAANTWTVVMVNIASVPNGGTWNRTNGVGLYIYWMMGAGSDFLTSSLNQWLSANKLMGSSSVQLMATNGATFEFNLVQMLRGTTGSPYQVKDKTEVQNDVYRYVESSYDEGVAPGTVTNAGAVTQNIAAVTGEMYGFSSRFKATKSATPTVTWYSPATGASGNIRNESTGGDLVVTANPFLGVNTTGHVNTASPTTAPGQGLAGHYLASSRL